VWGDDDDVTRRMHRCAANDDDPRLTPNVRCAGHRTNPGQAADRKIQELRGCHLLEETICKACQPACMKVTAKQMKRALTCAPVPRTPSERPNLSYGLRA